MVFGFPCEFPHLVFRDAKELERAPLLEHPHQLRFAPYLLLVVQNCVHKESKILCRQTSQLEHHLGAVQ